MRKNKTTDDYYVGGRKLNSLHIGLSVVATNVGGGFLIGLGGLGFTMSLSGSWLLFIGLPFAYVKIGGVDAILLTLDTEFLSLTSVSWQQIVNRMFTIIPIWFIGMTLYQRIYAAKDTKTAQKGWFIAGFLEYSLMAFIGL